MPDSADLDHVQPVPTSTNQSTCLFWSSVSMVVQHRSATVSSLSPSSSSTLAIALTPPVTRPSTPTSNNPPQRSNSISTDKSAQLALPPPYTDSSPSESSSQPHPLSGSSRCGVTNSSTRTRTWRFEFAFEGGSRVPGLAKPVRTGPGTIQIVIGFLVGGVLGVFGFLVSVSALLTTAVFPFLRAKAPQAISYAALKRHSTTSRSLPSPTSEHSHCDTAPRPEVHRQGSSSPTFTSATLSPVEQNASESSSIPSSSSPRATIPFPIERRVTFDLETSKTEEERHIITGPVHGDTISINPPLASQPETSNQATEGSPTALGSAQDKDGCKRLDFLGELCHHAPRRDSNASTSRSLVGRLLKRQNTASETGHCTETEADTVATPASTLASLPAGSRPSTPCPMSSSDDGHAEIGVPSTDSKNRRKMPLKLQLRAFKRRSVPGVPVTETPDALRDPSTSSSTPPTAISTESSSTAVKAGSGPDQTSGPPSATSATDKTRQKESPAAKKPKAFPFQHSAPSTRPMSPKKPLRTNPYGAPYFAPVPVPRERRSSRRISDDDDDDVEHVSPEDPPRRQERPRSMQASLSTPGGVVGLDLDLGLGSASGPSALSSQDGRRASARASLPPISGSFATTTAQPAKVKQRVVSAPVPARPKSAIPSSSSKPPVAGPRKSSAVNEFDLVSPSDLNAPGSHSDTEAMAPSAFKRRRSVFAKFRLGKPSHTGTDTESRSQPTSRTKAKA